MQNKSSYTPDPGAGRYLAQLTEGYTDSTRTRTDEEVDKSTDRPNDTSMTDLTRQEVDAKLAASEAKVGERLANFDASIKTGFAELRAEFADMRTEMAKQSGDLRTEMATTRAETHRGTVDVIKWVIGTILAVAAATVSILTFVINNVAPKTPAPAAVQPAPTVITVPVPQPAAAPVAAQAPAAKSN